MKKKSIGEIKLQIQAGKANPAPPIGPALGQKGLNIADFCKKFNDKTKDMEQGMVVPVVITAYADKSFDFIVKSPPVSRLVLKYSGLAKGSNNPGRETAGSIDVAKIKEIAKLKQEDMAVDSLESAIEMVKGTVRSMGININE